jgi:glycosyltransferase involved in cell wall biosynthesis
MANIEGKTLRLCIVTETYPPEINGVATTLRYWVEGLGQRGHEVQLIRPRQRSERPTVTDSGGREMLVEGLPIPGYPGLRFGLPIYRRLRRSWREAMPDAVYIATQGPLGHAASSAARAIGIPTLTGFHTRFHQYSGYYGLGLLRDYVVAVLRRFHNRSGATLVPTEQLRGELLGLGFERVRVLGHGVDTTLFDPSRRNEDLRRSWGCPAEGQAVLYVGRLAAEKNLELVLRAFERIASESSRAKLVLVGDGPQLARLRHLHPDLVFTGAKVGVELAEHFASGDLFLFPSLTETFGNVVAEAMASGPVVAFDYGAAGIWIADGVNGVTVPFGNADAFCKASVMAANNEMRLRTMGQGARATAESMSWHRITGNLEALLFEVIDHHRRAHPHETLAATTK